MTKIILFAMLVSFSVPIKNNSFKENIDGNWNSFISGDWKIVQGEKTTTFFKKEKDERGNNIEYSFTGTLKEDIFIDQFSFVGTAEDEFYQLENGDFCLLARTLKTKGRIDREKIHMSGCMIKETINCLSGKHNRKNFACSGTWR